jgi:hypothetical protein
MFKSLGTLQQKFAFYSFKMAGIPKKFKSMINAHMNLE